MASIAMLRARPAECGYGFRATAMVMKTFDFKLASSYASIEAFGNNFQWNRDQQAYLKRGELFNGLLDCDVARSYTGSTIVNTLPDN